MTIPCVLALVVISAVEAGPGAAAFFAGEVVTARRIDGAAPASPDDPRWTSATPLAVLLAPQHAVHLGDRGANAHAERGPTHAEVRATVTRKELAVLVEWPDDAPDHVGADETAQFGDSAAIEVPRSFGAGRRLPYIGMGDEHEHVAVFMQRATSAGSMGRDYVAAGFGSLTRADFGGSRMAMRYDDARRVWRAVFVRPLDSVSLPMRAGLVPVAFATWDGRLSERGGNKALSSWKFIRVESEPLDSAYVREMSWGFAAGDRGDAARGKQLVETVCIACHRIGDKRSAPADTAPDLSNVGAVSTYAYLRESLVDPSAIVVPILNINRHQVRPPSTGAQNAPAKANANENTGAFPNNELYRWWSVDASGKKVSRMMSFASMPPADVAAMVTYLKTLGTAEPTTTK